MNQYSRVYAKIDLDAVCHNMEAMRGLIRPDARMMAVVKTDGYGHGAVEIADAVEHLDYLWGFAVATAEEAMTLRRHGIRKPILILGYVFSEHYELLAKNDIRPTVFTLEMARRLSETAVQLDRPMHVHIAIDTGMSRIGMQVSKDSAKEIAQIASLPHMIVEGIFTHFARADERDKKATTEQYELFQRMLALVQEQGVSIPIRHCSNSAGIVDLPQMNMDLVRAGITLYGLWPSDEVQKERLKLRPVMELKSRVVYVKWLEAGRSVSYGGTYTASQVRRIATIPVGYGDGYPRSLSNVGYVLIHGKRAPICGRVCMDQFMVDVTDVPDVRIGDTVTLIGEDGEQSLSLEALGEMSGRFNYEFACDLGKRIPRVFVRDGRIVAARDAFNE